MKWSKDKYSIDARVLPIEVVSWSVTSHYVMILPSSYSILSHLLSFSILSHLSLLSLFSSHSLSHVSPSTTDGLLPFHSSLSLIYDISLLSLIICRLSFIHSPSWIPMLFMRVSVSVRDKEKRFAAERTWSLPVHSTKQLEFKKNI